MRHVPPPIPPKNTERQIYEAIRRLSEAAQGNSQGLASIGRGDTPDSSGTDLITKQSHHGLLDLTNYDDHPQYLYLPGRTDQRVIVPSSGGSSLTFASDLSNNYIQFVYGTNYTSINISPTSSSVGSFYLVPNYGTAAWIEVTNGHWTLTGTDYEGAGAGLGLGGLTAVTRVGSNAFSWGFSDAAIYNSGALHRFGATISPFLAAGHGAQHLPVLRLIASPPENSTTGFGCHIKTTVGSTAFSAVDSFGEPALIPNGMVGKVITSTGSPQRFTAGTTIATKTSLAGALPYFTAGTLSVPAAGTSTAFYGDYAQIGTMGASSSDILIQGEDNSNAVVFTVKGNGDTTSVGQVSMATFKLGSSTTSGWILTASGTTGLGVWAAPASPSVPLSLSQVSADSPAVLTLHAHVSSVGSNLLEVYNPANAIAAKITHDGVGTFASILSTGDILSTAGSIFSFGDLFFDYDGGTAFGAQFQLAGAATGLSVFQFPVVNATVSVVVTGSPYSLLLVSSTAASGTSFQDTTIGSKKLRMVLSGAVGSNAFTISTSAARVFTFGNATSNIVLVGNTAVTAGNSAAAGAPGKIDYTGLTASVASTKMLTNTTNTAGMYLISIYFVTTAGAAGTKTVDCTVSWNDGSAQAYNVVLNYNLGGASTKHDLTTTGAFSSVVFPILIAASTDVSIITTVAGAGGSPTYSFSARIEALG